MNYIDLLTQEEKPILCRIITGKDFKELFKRNEQEFSKIRKGFRAKSLTEQQALSIAIVNVDKPLIAMWVNTRVDIWLKEIQENIKELEEEGSTHDIALASTMLDSVFANNVDLYLKLAGKTMDADARSKLHERMESIKSERARNAEVADRSKVLEGEKHHVEVAVAERIQKARENAADFIANMAFVGGQPIQVAATETPAAVEVSSKPVIAPYHTFSAFDDLNDLEAHHSWADVINTAAFELKEAGVAEKYRSSLAAFLCAAYIEKQPIFLVGPNAIDIVQAFSAAVTGHKYGMLCCEGGYCNQVITEIGTDGENIVIINNLLASGWMNRLPEILSQKDIFYVATHPYAEDIQVEPKSLYEFMLPLFTEFFVDEKATGKYYGGYFAEDFKTYSTPKGTRKDLRVLSKLKIGSLVRNRINRLVATMHGIYSATTTDEDFLYAVLPIAYASLEINELTEAIADPQKGIAISESLKRDLQYVLGEF